MFEATAQSRHLKVALPDEGYHRRLISCQSACPVHTDARGYVRAVAEGRFDEAWLIARGPNPFASICGRVCGAPCEAACRRGRIPRVAEDGRYLGEDQPIAIRPLKRFAAESFGVESRPMSDQIEAVKRYTPTVGADAEEMAALLSARLRGDFIPAKGEKIAIIGAGPAGLSAAHDLALMGFQPIVFEVEPVPAGMLYVGVPEYRLPRELIRREVAVIEALGARIHCGLQVGRDISFAEIRRDHAAVIVAVGAKRSRALGLPGENGPRVYGGVDLLRAVALGTEINLGSEILVIGGGNVAYDVARTVLRQVAYDAARTAARLKKTHRVTLSSLETLEEMPADTIEIREGDEEGIVRLNGWGPVEIRRDAAGRPTGVAFRKCLRVYDEERRFAPVFDDGPLMIVACDTVLLAVGQATDLEFLEGAGVEEGRPGWPKIDQETLETTAAGVFVAGDLAHGTRLIIDAVASGKKAARSVYRHVTGRAIRAEAVEVQLVLDGYRRELGFETIRRAEPPTLSPTARLARSGACVEHRYDTAAARREASRCLDCGVTPVFDGTRCVLCGGCAEVCPTLCLKLVPLDGIAGDDVVDRAIEARFGADRAAHSAILKDEDRCIRCALCAQRCPVDAITMERVRFTTPWRCS
jgi:NADPH-dependent glutamate synthase beta subunit-like oxidoreductase/ferredoxin